MEQPTQFFIEDTLTILYQETGDPSHEEFQLFLSKLIKELSDYTISTKNKNNRRVQSLLVVPPSETTTTSNTSVTTTVKLRYHIHEKENNK